jgi:hypothetical protein
VPVCLVAKEYRSGQVLRFFWGELYDLQAPPFDTGPDTIVIAYYASAEVGCFLALNWSLPDNLLDLYVEFRNITNGLSLPCGRSLLGALAYFGEPSIDAVEKDSMRQLIMHGEPYSPREVIAIREYCESDVQALERLLSKLQPYLDVPRALLRGRYMKAAALIEHAGVPVDVSMLKVFRENLDDIKDLLISRIDAHYGIFDGHTFREEKFKEWLSINGIPWPRLDSGRLDLKDDTFKAMARVYPRITPLRELRITLSQIRLHDLAVGKDGRNRCVLWAFSSRTGRNQPSNNKFIFGPAVWIRSLIKPGEGYALAHIDWAQQEFGIAASLSGDQMMKRAYSSGDPYLAFAKQANAVPSNATKVSHENEREQFKACVLAVQYGMGEKSLAEAINQPVAKARELLQLHRETYRVFWQWSDGVLNYAMLHGEVWTVFGWTLHIRDKANPRSIRNFLMQANGAEILRLACCLTTDRGINVCAPIHDAILIEAPIDEIDNSVAIACEAMAEASRIVLNGFELNTDVELVRYPDRYMDKRGRDMWFTVQEVLTEIGVIAGSADTTEQPVQL